MLVFNGSIFKNILRTFKHSADGGVFTENVFKTLKYVQLVVTA